MAIFRNPPHLYLPAARLAGLPDSGGSRFASAALAAAPLPLGLGFRVLWFRGLGVWGLGFRGLGVWGLGFRV